MAVTMNYDFYGMWPRVFWRVETDVSEKNIAVIIKEEEWKQFFD
jgi:hypothetical protein